jgi:hypothetical protein
MVYANGKRSSTAPEPAVISISIAHCKFPKKYLYVSPPSETTAPAQVEIVGAQKPLARLRFYLQLERDTRAENFLVSCSSEIALLRGQNIPEAQIQAALGRHLLAHFQRLDAAAELTLCD